MSLNLTASGHEMLLRAMAGEVSIEFTEIQLGNGADAGENATQLSNPLLALSISKYEITDIFLILTAIFNNGEIEAGFRATETGVFVKDPENADELILYAYEHVSEDIAGNILAGTDRIVETQFDVVVYIGEAENVTASISQSAIYASQSELKAHTERRDNPHNVTKAQVGLDNVPNVTPENQQPVFSNVITPVSESETGEKRLANIQSGDKIGTIMQKVRSAIAALVNHFNAENPHALKAEDVRAAKEIHAHSTNDLNAGVLGIPRGGTGGETAYEARVNLGIQAGTCWSFCIAGNSAVSGPIYFEKPFGNIPKVVATLVTMGAGDPLDVKIAVKNVSKEGFYVDIVSETVDHNVHFNWIACL